VQLGLDALVPLSTEPLVYLEGRPKCDAVPRCRSIRSDKEGKRPEEPGRDPGERSTFPDRLPGATEAPGLQRAQAAMRRLLVIERGTAAEVSGLDERDGEAAARGVIGESQAMNATTHDQEVVGAFLEAVEIT
jgi:hypothetical protein